MVRAAEPEPQDAASINSHNINAFGDVSFVEAASSWSPSACSALLLARAEGRDFNMPGGDGTIVALAGGGPALLIFYRVFDRPGGNGYPVGIQWGFFLAFVAAGSLAYAGWRMRSSERPAMPVRRRHRAPAPDPEGSAARDGAPGPEERPETDETSLVGVGGAPRAEGQGSRRAQPAAGPGPGRAREPRRPGPAGAAGAATPALPARTGRPGTGGARRAALLRGPAAADR